MSGSSAKKLVSNSIIYSITGILQKCFSLFLMPLYTVYLTTADYGITSVAGSFSTTMGFVISLSLFSAVTRFYVELKDDPKKLSRFYGTVVLHYLGLAADGAAKASFCLRVFRCGLLSGDLHLPGEGGL